MEDIISQLLESVGKLELRCDYIERSIERDHIIVKRRKTDDDCIFPTKAHLNDAGWDLYAAEDAEIPIGKLCKISTGLSLQIPDGFYGQICDRSGLGSKSLKVHGGIVDSSYRGTIFVCLSNLSFSPFYKVTKGDRIAQILFSRVPEIYWSETEFDDSERGENGFASTGL
jgi:dUTP pyrophosphatase